jgi:hypothetical protein
MPEIIQDILIMDISIFSMMILIYFYQPPEINFLMGYRTKRSMKKRRKLEIRTEILFQKNCSYSSCNAYLPNPYFVRKPLGMDN